MKRGQNWGANQNNELRKNFSQNEDFKGYVELLTYLDFLNSNPVKTDEKSIMTRVNLKLLGVKGWGKGIVGGFGMKT